MWVEFVQGEGGFYAGSHEFFAAIFAEAKKQNVTAFIVDTVGAGDSFSGGFLAQWAMRGLGRGDLGSLDEVLSAARFGISVAGITCQRAGADPPRLAEL